MAEQPTISKAQQRKAALEVHIPPYIPGPEPQEAEAAPEAPAAPEPATTEPERQWTPKVGFKEPSSPQALKATSTEPPVLEETLVDRAMSPERATELELKASAVRQRKEEDRIRLQKQLEREVAFKAANPPPVAPAGPNEDVPPTPIAQLLRTASAKSLDFSGKPEAEVLAHLQKVREQAEEEEVAARTLPAEREKLLEEQLEVIKQQREAETRLLEDLEVKRQRAAFEAKTVEDRMAVELAEDGQREATEASEEAELGAILKDAEALRESIELKEEGRRAELAQQAAEAATQDLLGLEKAELEARAAVVREEEQAAATLTQAMVEAMNAMRGKAEAEAKAKAEAEAEAQARARAQAQAQAEAQAQAAAQARAEAEAKTADKKTEKKDMPKNASFVSSVRRDGPYVEEEEEFDLRSHSSCSNRSRSILEPVEEGSSRAPGEAAAVIQRGFRCHTARQTAAELKEAKVQRMQQIVQTETSSSPVAQQPSAAELEQGAGTIQRNYRSHLARKEADRLRDAKNKRMQEIMLEETATLQSMQAANGGFV